MKSRAKILMMFMLGIIFTTAQSQGTIYGIIVDKTTGRALSGVNITNQEKMSGTSSAEDGSFSFNLSTGKHLIMFSMIGYTTEFKEVFIYDSTETDLGRISLSPEVIGLSEITVISSVAVDRKSPLTVSTIKAESIETRLGDEPLPEVMKMVPGVYATRTGGGSGDAAVNIRGFKQENITLLLNGIPVSSVENGLVYWNNWLGLSDATDRIQIQRGLSASPVAMNSVGGTINIITKTTEPVTGGSLGFSITDYGNTKFSFSYNTGKMDNGMAISFLGSHIRGPGYVDATYVRGWGYFLSVSKTFNDEHKLVFIGLGNPEKHGQRNFMLKPEETARYGLKFNKDWGSYNGEINNSSENFYHKPHLSLSHYWTINKKSMLATAAYFSYGYGGGKWSDNFMTDRRIWDFRNPSGQIDWEAIYFNNASHTDTFLLASGQTASGFSKNIQTDFLASHIWTGVLSTFDHQISETLKLTAGIHYRFFRSTLQQKVRDLLGGDYYIDDYAWSLAGVAGRDQMKYRGDIVKVDNGALIHYINLFGQANYTSGRWDAFLAGSITQNLYQRVDHYNYTDDPYSQQVRLAGFDARGGINFKLNEFHHLYMNAGYFSRVPYYKFIFGNFTNQVSANLQNEMISSAEAGYGMSYDHTRIRLNAYYLYWKDRSFLANEYNQFLDPVLIHGLDAVHKGVEMEISQRLNKNISLAGIVSVGDWKWQNDVDAEVYDNNNVLLDTISVYANGLYVGDAPQTQFGLSGNYSFLDHFTLVLNWVYYDRLYADFDPVKRNSANDREQSFRIPSYHLLDAHFTITFKALGVPATANLSILNLLNSEHIMRGLDGSDHSIDSFTGFWGFGRTATVGLKLYF
ncbi:MAG: TonB-dependent receptor [Bacteroidales bacterium]|nr:TonB-dependent receptor [Bacteroidales bacterium]